MEKIDRKQNQSWSLIVSDNLCKKYCLMSIIASVLTIPVGILMIPVVILNTKCLVEVMIPFSHNGLLCRASCELNFVISSFIYL